jgi:hypothetical protein
MLIAAHDVEQQVQHTPMQHAAQVDVRGPHLHARPAHAVFVVEQLQAVLGVQGEGLGGGEDVGAGQGHGDLGGAPRGVGAQSDHRPPRPLG